MTEDDDIDGLAGEYVLGSLSADERREVGSRRRADRALEAAIGAWEQRLAPLIDRELAQGEAPYPKKVTNVCQLANLYPQYFQVVALADAKVNSLADLKGKTLVTQPKGNTGELLTEQVLKINGMSYQSLAKANFQAAYNDAVAMMKDGHAQVFTLGTTAPASAVMDLASARDVKLVPVDDKTFNEVKRINPGHNKLIIKAGTYPKQDKDVPVIGYSTHVVVACDLPEDVVYKMAKAMAANVDDMAAVVKAIGGSTPKDMALDIGVPFHKGAVKFYKEAGAM